MTSITEFMTKLCGSKLKCMAKNAQLEGSTDCSISTPLTMCAASYSCTVGEEVAGKSGGVADEFSAGMTKSTVIGSERLMGTKNMLEGKEATRGIWAVKSTA